MRILELFAGIGGAHAATRGTAHKVLAAVDHDRRATEVYATAWGLEPIVRNLASVRAPWLRSLGADLWWMSPPCAPHGIRGGQDDLDDPRSDALRNLMRLLPEVLPSAIALENVPWFAGSRAHAALREVLDANGYQVVEGELCPSAMGAPAVRRRFYLAASRAPLGPWPTFDHPLDAPPSRSLADHLDPWDEALAVPPPLLERFGGAFHVVNADDPGARAACFTRAYGKSPVYVGSYLRQDGRIRYFSPDEIARLYGFPADFSLARLSLRDGWKLIGNSVAVPVVREVLRAAAPDLSPADAP